MTASNGLLAEQSTGFALFMQRYGGPINWEVLRIAFAQEEILAGRRDRLGRSSGLPYLQMLLADEFENRRRSDGHRLLLIPDQVLEPGKLYRFSFWLNVWDLLGSPDVKVFANIDRARFFLFSQSRRAFGVRGEGWGRLSYFVAVPERTPWAMRIRLTEDDREPLFGSEKRSQRFQRKPKPKRRHSHAIRPER